jgi:hypothetical protein
LHAGGFSIANYSFAIEMVEVLVEALLRRDFG